MAKLNFFRVGSLDREKADPVFPKWQETDAFIEHVEIQFLSQGICSLNIRRVQRNMVDGTRVSHSATIFIALVIFFVFCILEILSFMSNKFGMDFPLIK